VIKGRKLILRVIIVFQINWCCINGFYKQDFLIHNIPLISPAFLPSSYVSTQLAASEGWRIVVTPAASLTIAVPKIWVGPKAA
jgi:hypothetical protein